MVVWQEPEQQQPERRARAGPGRMQQGRPGVQPVQPPAQADQENKQIEVSRVLPPVTTELNKLGLACVAAAWRLVKRYLAFCDGNVTPR